MAVGTRWAIPEVAPGLTGRVRVPVDDADVIELRAQLSLLFGGY